MKGKKTYTCDCCGTKTNHARPVAGTIICNTCNIKLLKDGKVYFTEDSGLRLAGKNGDCYIVKPFKDIKSDFWERRRRVMEQMEMDNQSLVNFETHESY